MLHEKIQKMRDDAVTAGRQVVPDVFDGVSKDRIASVLRRIDLNSSDTVDAVFALLDDETPNWFTSVTPTAHFCDGASTAMVGCHVGILQRGKGKLDREGRDYWLKPLWGIGAVEKVFLYEGAFIPGHPIAKSGNCAYRLAHSFKAILTAPDDTWEKVLSKWIKADAVRRRLDVQAKLAAESAAVVDTKHSDLIRKSIAYYVPNFLNGYKVVYIDDGDGDRITAEQNQTLKTAGITIKLGDAMPDILLWDKNTDLIWVIEAVTSDGEVDEHKAAQVMSLATRCGKKGVGFTTVYPNWKVAAARQSKHKNLRPDSFMWIAEDPSRQFHVISF